VYLGDGEAAHGHGRAGNREAGQRINFFHGQHPMVPHGLLDLGLHRRGHVFDDHGLGGGEHHVEAVFAGHLLEERLHFHVPVVLDAALLHVHPHKKVAVSL